MGEEPGLKQELGLLEVILCGVGSILGAGIYVLVGKAAGFSGNLVWLSFLFAGTAAGLSALSYMELSSMYPKAGAEYEFVRKAFGESAGLLIGLLIIYAVTITSSAVALGFGGYYNALFGGGVLKGALIVLLGLGPVMLYGVRESVRFAALISLIEVLGLLIIIYIGLPHLGSVNYFEPGEGGLPAVFEASALVFFAFLGFEDLVRLAQETKNAERTMPKALTLVIISTVSLYICVAVAAVSVLDFRTLGESNAPLADVAAVALGADAFVLLSWIALFSTVNTVLVLMLGGSRIIYGMADSASLPKIFARVHPGRGTPWVSIISILGLSILFVFIRDIATVANISNFMIFIVFFTVNLALIKLRYTAPEKMRPFRIPGNVGKFPLPPALAALSVIFLFTRLSAGVMLYGFVLLGLSVLIVFLKTGWKK
ncbi:MAG: APC family permease [Methanosarcinaceae archaeon]|nr:APC family permease [Methanosarcinaceae archaeon]